MIYIEKCRIELTQMVKSISYSHKCLFILLTCEKMLPAYIAFSGDENWGNPQALKDKII
jgi:hypothetical protein